jgi:high affinity Mn2+ porin
MHSIPILRLSSILFLLFCIHSKAQQSDSSNTSRYTIHAQTTIINQTKPAFLAAYTGTNSLVPERENQTSITSTLFLGSRLWKGASVFINPEIAGGSGLSQALGVAASTNGETFRVGSPEPKIYVARLFLSQVFALNKDTAHQEDDLNQISGYVPVKYFSFIIGKICLADYFDNNKYSHDPKTQFMSWGLMDNGAWDYPANTRGYTPSIVLQFVSPKYEWRYALSLTPKTANGNVMDWDLTRANSSSLEFTYKYKIKEKEGALRLLAFYSTTHMGNYEESLRLQPDSPDILQSRQYGRTKLGFTINAEQEIIDDLGCFFRAGWNDGENETWHYTEMDHTISAGLVLRGDRWKRPTDNIGLAMVASGLSLPHRNYLKAGGNGFILGDGNLNYGWEKLMELYYSTLLEKHFHITGAYQLIMNPGYNKDRGPVHVFSLRLHVEI